MNRSRSSIPYAVCGLAAAVAGAGLGHLAAALTGPTGSPVVAVSSAVVDHTPTALKEWAIRTFGTSDKTVLLGTVLLVTLALAAGAGALARRHRTAALVGFAVLVALATGAAMARPAAGQLAFLPGLVTGVVGLGTASWLWRGLDGSDQLASYEPGSGGRPLTGSDLLASYAPGRRVVVVGAGAAAAAGVVGAALGQAWGGTPSLPGTAADAIPDLTLPSPRAPLPPAPHGLESTYPDITPLATDVADLYRIDTALAVPRIDPQTWTLTVEGLVDRPFTLTWAELLTLPMVEKDITLCCVSNPVGGRYNGTIRWLGTPVRALLERAGIQAASDMVFTTDVDGMTISVPRYALTDDRGALLAIGMNGHPLTREHGAPVRLVTPGLYGFIGATKWVTRLKASRYADDIAYWTYRGWADDIPILTQSRIDTPRDQATVSAGPVTVGGVAWAQHRGVAKVEVRVDDGPWQTTQFGPDLGIECWRQWAWRWDATPGTHRLTVRATDRTGATQTSEESQVIPAGATGWHAVEVTVS